MIFFSENLTIPSVSFFLKKETLVNVHTTGSWRNPWMLYISYPNKQEQQ